MPTAPRSTSSRPTPDTDSFEYHLRTLAEHSDRAYEGTLEGITNIRIYGQPAEAVLRVLKESVGPDVPITVFGEHLGGFTRVA